MASNSRTRTSARGSGAVAGELFLDRALWKQFQLASGPEDFAAAWLALQCRFVGGVESGVIVLGDPGTGPFRPVAFWPDEEASSELLSEAADRALLEKRAVVLTSGNGSTTNIVASPLSIDGELFGVVALQLGTDSKAPRTVIRELQWGTAWIELLYVREQSKNDEQQRDRSAVAFNMLAAVLENSRFMAACQALVTELASALQCDPVCIGFTKRGRCEVTAVSHAALFSERLNLIQDFGAAMDEAGDQRAIVMYPPVAEWDHRITRVHEALAIQHQSGPLLTIPLVYQDSCYGAIVFERPAGEDFDERTVELCDAVATIVGPILEEKRQNDRNIAVKLYASAVNQLKQLVGPEYFGRKLLAGIVLALVVFFSVAEGEHRISAPARIEGRIQRTVVAPFDGYIAAQFVRAGEQVSAGQVLARLDNQDLGLERIQWSTRQRQSTVEYDQALAAGERATANIARARVEQADAQIALLDEQLARTKITAPFAGVIVTGDLSQAVGTTVSRGEELFQLAPLGEHRVVLEVDESHINDIRRGQNGELRLAAMTDASHGFTVERITPVAEQGDGRNFFLVEAALDANASELRPGMEGIAKTYVEQRRLIWIWTETLVNWLRIFLWKWVP